MQSTSSSPESNQLTSLPIIDISPYLNIVVHAIGRNGGRQATSAALHAACITYGFFYLDISSYVDSSETEELTSLARKFFALAESEKDKCALKNEDGVRGYARLRQNVTNGKADEHEGLDFYAPVAHPDKTRPLWGQNQWPEVDGFRENFEKWTEKMKKLGLAIMEAMAVGLGMQSDEWKELLGQVDDSFWVMRVIGYPPLPRAYDGFSCGAHKDYGCLTFLYADPTPNALQVFLPRSPGISPSVSKNIFEKQEKHELVDGAWINVNPIPGCVVCNIGEMWEIWSNGLYRSTLHRVIHTGSNFRISIPFFFEPNLNAHISPLAAALRIQAEPSETANETKNDMKAATMNRYAPVTYGDFLLKKVTNNFDLGEEKNK